MEMSVINVTNENFNEIISGDKPVLLDFYADWCGPCQMISPIVKEICEENDNITVGKINVDEEPVLARKFSVMSIPMLVVMKNGKVTNHAIGYREKQEILDMLND